MHLERKTGRRGHAQVDPSVHHVQQTIGCRRRAVRDELVVFGEHERHVFPVPKPKIVLLPPVVRLRNLESPEQRLRDAENRLDERRILRYDLTLPLLLTVRRPLP